MTQDEKTDEILAHEYAEIIARHFMPAEDNPEGYHYTQMITSAKVLLHVYEHEILPDVCGILVRHPTSWLVDVDKDQDLLRNLGEHDLARLVEILEKRSFLLGAGGQFGVVRKHVRENYLK